jgi:protein disulfide-isomerase
MKKIFTLSLLLLMSLTINAQDLVWETNVNKAIERSNTEKKPIFLFFTGSDWCGWCIKLQNEVFKTPEFAAWAKQNVVLVDLDFPRRTPQADELKAQNNSLQQTFAIQGFPSIRIVNSDLKEGKISFDLLGGLGYMAGGPSAWLAEANNVLKLNKKVYASNTSEKKPETKKKKIKK